MDREPEKRDYFKSVIKEAVKDLKKKRKAYVFSQEQINEIKKIKELENVKIKNDEGIYLLTI